MQVTSSLSILSIVIHKILDTQNAPMQFRKFCRENSLPWNRHFSKPIESFFVIAESCYLLQLWLSSSCWTRRSYITTLHIIETKPEEADDAAIGNVDMRRTLAVLEGHVILGDRPL